MRRTLLASLLAFGLGLPAAMVRADEPAVAATAAPAPRATRLVGVMLSSAQALLWDDERGEYVLHHVGDDALGGRLVELDADHVVIERGEAREVMELTAPPQMRVAGKKAPKRMPAMLISAVPERAELAAATPAPAAATALAAPVAAPALAAPVAAPALAAPVAAPAVAAPTVAAPAAPAIVSAPAPALVAPPSAPAMVAPPAGDIAIAPAPVVAPPLAPAPAPSVTPAAPATVAPAVPPAPVVAPALPPPPAASAPSPAATSPVVTPVTPSAPATPAVAAAVSPRPGTALLIPRADLDRALGDFAALSQDVQVDQQPSGGFRLVSVRSGSFFERIGLRPNDVILRVDGRAINGVDDASAAYAWLRVTNQFTVDILRNGHPVALRYVIAQPMTASAQ